MMIFPAIDIRGGQCVRLLKGDFAQETVFSDNPAAMAQQWQAQGARYLGTVSTCQPWRLSSMRLISRWNWVVASAL